MIFDVHEVSGIGGFETREQGGSFIYSVTGGGKAFLIVNLNTIEVRTDDRLKKVLCEKFESVMESRYFGRAGIEIVMSGQLPDDDIKDLVRLSYNMTVKQG